MAEPCGPSSAIGGPPAAPSAVVGGSERRNRGRSPLEYQGPDRRVAAVSSGPGPSPAAFATASLVLLLAGAAAALGVLGPTSGLGVERPATTADAALDAVAVAVAVLAVAVARERWQLTRDARSVRVSAALVVIGGCVILEPLLSGWASTTPTSPLTALSLSGRVVALAVLGLALCGPEINSHLHLVTQVTRALTICALGALTILTVGPIRSFALVTGRSGTGVVAGFVVAGWFSMGVVHAVVGLRRGTARHQWLGLALMALALSDLALLTHASDAGQVFARSVRVFALGTALYAFLAELRDTLLGELERDLEAHHVVSRSVDRLVQQRQRQREVAHDAASSLMAIDGTVRALGQLTQGSDESSRLVWAARREIARLHTLVGDTPRPDTPADFDVMNLVEAMALCYRASDFPVVLDGRGPVWCRGHEADTGEVVQNLIDNAIRHAPGCEVRVTIDAGLSAVLLTVSDDGPGVDPSDRERIFERDHRGPNSTGSGLGLYVARRLMEVQGGRLDLLTGPKGGTTFVVTLTPSDGPPDVVPDESRADVRASDGRSDATAEVG